LPSGISLSQQEVWTRDYREYHLLSQEPRARVRVNTGNDEAQSLIMPRGQSSIVCAFPEAPTIQKRRYSGFGLEEVTQQPLTLPKQTLRVDPLHFFHQWVGWLIQNERLLGMSGCWVTTRRVSF